MSKTFRIKRDANVIVTYEVRNPKGKLIGEFLSLDEANECFEEDSRLSSEQDNLLSPM